MKTIARFLRWLADKMDPKGGGGPGEPPNERPK
jgi:hypothetical protein